MPEQVLGRNHTLIKPGSFGWSKRPLFVVTHGGGSNKETIEKTTGFSDYASSERFYIVYPDGTEGIIKGSRTWNSGGGCCGAAATKNVDDTAYLKALIDYTIATNKVNPYEVYIIGMSNGAMEAYRFACEAPEKVAGVVVVAGTLNVDDCSKAKKVRILHMHGEKDENVPLLGGVGDDSVSKIHYRSVPESIGMFLAHRGKINEVETSSYGYKQYNYECSDGAPIELKVVNNGKHMWFEWPLDATREAIDFCLK